MTAHPTKPAQLTKPAQPVQPRSHAKRPKGRRGGDSGTREAIENAAIALFSERGYDATSMRAIAAAAGVDPALIRHFYADKSTLFACAFAARTDVPRRISEAVPGDPTTVGLRVADTYLRLWDDPDTQPVLMALVKAAMTSDAAAAMLAEAMNLAMSTRTQSTGVSAQRLALVAAHLLGVAIARHILKLPPIARMSHAQLINAIAPAIQQQLRPTGE